MPSFRWNAAFLNLGNHLQIEYLWAKPFRTLRASPSCMPVRGQSARTFSYLGGDWSVLAVNTRGQLVERRVSWWSARGGPHMWANLSTASTSFQTYALAATRHREDYFCIYFYVYLLLSFLRVCSQRQLQWCHRDKINLRARRLLLAMARHLAVRGNSKQHRRSLGHIR